MSDEKSIAVRVTEVKQWLEAPERLKELSKILPNRMTPEGFVRVVMTACIQNHKLVECSLESMWLTVMQAAQLGLPLDGRFAAAVPYKGRLTFQPMAQGYVELMYRNPRVLDVQARVIYEKDEFDYQEGLRPVLTHRPSPPPHGEVIAAYARGLIRGGGHPFRFLWREEIETEHRAYSKQKDNPQGAWMTHYAAMCEKTAILVLSKNMPKSPEFLVARALDADPENESPLGPPHVPSETGVSEILDAIATSGADPQDTSQ